MTLFPTGGEHDFNPRSHEGSDKVRLDNGPVQKDFNPRSHEGSDQSGEIRDNWYTEISIHAPTRGATRPLVKGILRHLISIHAPTRGATVPCFWDPASKVFQSTLPRGERRLIPVRPSLHSYFNPRSHEGSDLNHIQQRKCPDIFQSTLPRGERHVTLLVLGVNSIFQSTLPRGERHTLYVLCAPKNHFNPRSHEGSDGRIFHKSARISNFNPRSHEGSDGDPRHLYPGT